MTPHALTLSEFTRQVVSWVPGLPPGQVPPVLGTQIGLAIAADMRQRFQTSTAPDGTPWLPLVRPRPNGGSKPLLDTGTLRNSIVGRAEPDGGSAGTNLVQAELMNAGGIVRPVKGKFLAIPATREAKRVGSPRRFPQKLRAVIGKRGGVLLDRGGHVQFWLAREVRIPARPFVGVSPDGLAAIEGLVIDYLTTPPA